VSTATEQLLRLLRLIPLASRPEGLRIPEAARLCGVTEAVIRADVRVLTDRAWYLPPGSTDDFQILLEGDRIHVLAPPAFGRPIRLGLHEMLAVSLALRCAGMEQEEARELCLALEKACAMEPEMQGAWGAQGGQGAQGAQGGQRARGRQGAQDVPGAAAADEPVAVILRRGQGGNGEQADDPIHDPLSRALVRRHRIHVQYLKEGASAPETRHLEPWSLLHAEGESYLLAFDLDRAAPRLFRGDRILGVHPTGDPCTTSVDLDASDLGEGGAVRLVADGRPLETAEIRYAPGVARWIRERHPEGRSLEDGSYVVTHPILTDAWIVRRVLFYGPDAEVLGPPRLREAVLRALEG
jgi:predicted DNA-binding transcriptional regulator YafY